MRHYLHFILIILILSTFLVFFGCEDSTEPNILPEIRAIEANPDAIFSGDKCDVSCTAIDPDGDELTYQWTADVGTFEDPNSPQTVWTAPDEEGSYKLKCTVSDGKGMRWATVKVSVIQFEIPEGVTAYWPFESNFRDFAGTNDANPGSTGPVINNDDALMGIGCAEFNGEDGDVASSVLYDGSALKMGPDDNFTISLWIKTEDDGALLFGKSFNGNYIGDEETGDGGKALNLEGVVIFDCWGIDGVGSETEVNDGEWHHVAVVKNGLNVKIYVDGELDGESDFGDWSKDGATVITMGAGSEEGDVWPGTYVGLMDDVRFYQKALTDEEIVAIFNEAAGKR